MDIFVEQLLTVNSKLAKVKSLFIILASIILILLTINIGCIVPFMATLSLLIVIFIIYSAFRLIKNQRIEFEYAITNNEFCIDKIIDKRKRKHILTFDLNGIREIDRFSNLKDRKTKIIKACADETDTSTLFLKLRHQTIGDVTLLISPNEKILNAMKPFIRKQAIKNGISGN